MSLESIKLKIAALLAKAERTDNEFEAAAFMAKVNELLEKHRIEMYQVRSAQMDAEDPIGVIDGDVNLYASMLWARTLGEALARYYGCRMVYRKNGNHFTYQILGRESARITFELMFPYVISQVRLQAKKLCAEKNNTQRGTVERDVGQALTIRIWRDTQKNEENRIVLTGQGLIPVDDLDAAYASHFPNVKSAKSKT